MGTVLVFPAVMPAASDFARLAHSRGETVIGITSVPLDDPEPAYARVLTVPYISDAGFAEAFADMLRDTGATQVFTPHLLAHRVIQEVIDRHALSVTMAAHSPLEELDAQFRRIREKAERYVPFMRMLEEQSGLETSELAALFMHALRVYGQTNEAKIAAFAGIFPSLPKGDVVEIGVAWGRSALALTTLSRRFGTGNVLVMDPWECEAAQQHESPDRLKDFNRAIDWDALFDMFRMNLLPYSYGILNYCRSGAEVVAPSYRPGFTVRTPDFGMTRYEGRIALLHIDGNHDYPCVKRDYELWAPHVVPGGWIVFDDYVWEHGDGPRRFVDELLHANCGLERGFAVGGALFVRKR